MGTNKYLLHLYNGSSSVAPSDTAFAANGLKCMIYRWIRRILHTRSADAYERNEALQISTIRGYSLSGIPGYENDLISNNMQVDV